MKRFISVISLLFLFLLLANKSNAADIDCKQISDMEVLAKIQCEAQQVTSERAQIPTPTPTEITPSPAQTAVPVTKVLKIYPTSITTPTPSSSIVKNLVEPRKRVAIDTNKNTLQIIQNLIYSAINFFKKLV